MTADEHQHRNPYQPEPRPWMVGPLGLALATTGTALLGVIVATVLTPWRGLAFVVIVGAVFIVAGWEEAADRKRALRQLDELAEVREQVRAVTARAEARAQAIQADAEDRAARLARSA